MKHVTLEGGIKVGIFEKPPTGMDPFTASQAELRKYGLPPVPEDPRHRERYQRLFRQIRRKLTFVEPTFRVNPARFPRPPHRGNIRRPGDVRVANDLGNLRHRALGRLDPLDAR